MALGSNIVPLDGAMLDAPNRVADCRWSGVERRAMEEIVAKMR